jgi:hypothetical protein
MEGTVYHASPDGKLLISSNLTTTRRTQPGYGVRVPDETIRKNIGPSVDDGFYLTDTKTGKSSLFASISSLLAEANPPVLIKAPEKQEIYGFHSKFNPQGDRLMLSLRWYPAREGNDFDMFKRDFWTVRYAWITLPLSGKSKHCAIGPEQWEKNGHHATWFPDGRHISMNLNINRDRMRFVQVKADGKDLRPIRDDLTGSGHPTIHPDGRHLLTDSYNFEEMAFKDGSVPLRWIDLKTGEERMAVRIGTRQQSEDSVMRIDPHPAWDRTYQYIFFNGFYGGTRRVFMADMRSLLKKV